MYHQRGFTLVELLVVIGIVAVLAVVVVVVLNPAQLLQQSRDTQRFNDLTILNQALSTYITEVRTVSLGNTSNCYAHVSSTLSSCAARFPTGGGTVNGTGSTSLAIDGTGWVPVDFTAVSAGAPLEVLPLDPVNNGTYFYAYKTSSAGAYEVNANMESTKYASGGSADRETNDGGDSTSLYEVGSDPGLNL